MTTHFGFVQLEFGFLLGPADGRFLVREPGSEEPTRVLVLATLEAPRRGGRKARRGRAVTSAEAEAVPITRATAIQPEPFEDRAAAESWLASLRSSEAVLEAELHEGLRTLNRALAAHRAARATPHARDVSPDVALVVRVGYGSGEAVAEGQYADAWELPHGATRVKRSMEAPDERFAALLGGRETALAAEELVLRARVDLDAGRGREAALQARIALESLLAELTTLSPERRAALQDDRGPVGEAANAALRGDLDAATLEHVTGAVERLEGALRSHRLSSSSR